MSWETIEIRRGANFKSTSLVLFTFLSSSENFGDVKHTHLSDDPFIGTVEKHMSSHYCVPAGLLPLGRYEDSLGPLGPLVNGACVIKNLYYSASSSSPDSEYSGVWIYATSVFSEEVGRGLWGYDALRDLIWSLETELRVSLSSRIPQKGNTWPISIAVYSASPAQLTGVVETNSFVDVNKKCVEKSGRNHECGQTTVKSKTTRLSCAPPDVHFFIQNSMFLLPLTNDGNIGHSLWDDIIPFFSIANFLGLSPRLHEFDLLLLRNPTPWLKPEVSLSPVRELFKLSSPGRCQQDLKDLNTIFNGSTALFSEVVGGLTHASPHNLRPDMKVFGWESRPIWQMRRYILDAAGIVNNISKLTDGIHRFNLLYVRSKRSVRNEAELLSYLRREFQDLNVNDISWESLGGGADGLRAEMLKLSQTHILLSGDGSVSTTVPFLPAGAVHIQLGSNRPWGTQFKIDMLLSNLDHVRVLYYGGRAHSEHDGDPEHDFVVPPLKLAPFIEEALRLLREGFDIPVSPEVNLVPSAKLLSHLITKFTDFASFIHAGGITWEDIKFEPYEIQAAYFYRKYVVNGDSAAADAFERSAREFCESQGCRP
jgi:hypothetical protein